MSDPVIAVFMLGLFWKKTTNRAAIWGAVSSIPIALYFKVAPNGWSESALFLKLPFMDQMFWTWIITMIIMALISYSENKGADHEKGIPISRKLFETDRSFNISAGIISVILVILYFIFW